MKRGLINKKLKTIKTASNVTQKAKRDRKYEEMSK